jgi:hypothetical protein
MDNSREQEAVRLVWHLYLEGVLVFACPDGDILIGPDILTDADRELLQTNRDAVTAFIEDYARKRPTPVNEDGGERHG